MICELLAVGTELLLGEIANTDAQMISQGLSENGITVYYHTVCGDNPERLKAAQRLWVQLRDADLAAQFPLAEGQSAQLEYGSIYLLEYATAQAELTRQRTAYLRAHFLADVSR